MQGYMFTTVEEALEKWSDNYEYPPDIDAILEIIKPYIATPEMIDALYLSLLTQEAMREVINALEMDTEEDESIRLTVVELVDRWGESLARHFSQVKTESNSDGESSS